MRKCNSCNIEFNINDNHCPLCQNILMGTSEDVLFPKNIRYKTNSLILKILLFISIVVILIVGFIELISYDKLNVTSYVSMALMTNYVVVYFILKNFQNIYHILGKYGIIVTTLLLIWYAVTKTKIITNYIIPGVCIFELISTSVLGIILRKNYFINYTGQILMNIFLLFIPIILVALNLTTNNLMSYICCLLSIITIIGLLIFFFDDILDELNKIFNL